MGSNQKRGKRLDEYHSGCWHWRLAVPNQPSPGQPSAVSPSHGLEQLKAYLIRISLHPRGGKVYVVGCEGCTVCTT